MVMGAGWVIVKNARYFTWRGFCFEIVVSNVSQT